MKLYVKIALFIVFFLALITILTALYKFNMKHSDLAKAKPDFIITATALQKAFEDDDKKASATYINKILEVTGTIVSITPANGTNTNISLKTGNDISSVICTFTAIMDPLKLKTGEEFALRGECSGFTQLFSGEPPVDVLLNNCAMIAGRK